jgi:hypothetical protein
MRKHPGKAIWVGSSRWTISNDLSFLDLRLRQVSVFGVKKLMSTIAQLYDDFFTEFITLTISVYNDITDSNQL